MADFNMPPAPASFDQRGGWVVLALMRDLGLVMNAAGGIVGNTGFESGGFQKLHEIGQPEGVGGYGWGQWTADRRRTFLAWCDAAGLDWQSDAANYGYLVHELAGAYHRTVDALKALGPDVTLDDAVWSVGQTYERPGGTTEDNLPGYDGRMRWGELAVRGALALQKAGGAPVAAASVPATSVAPAPPADPVVTKAVDLQIALRDAGLYKGALDGWPGPETYAALREYRSSKGV